MSSYLIGNAVTGNGDVYTLDGSDDILVTRYGSVGSQTGIAINGGGSFNTVTIEGAAMGYNGAVKLGSSVLNDRENLLYVSDTGSLNGTYGSPTVSVFGAGEIDNHGSIQNRASYGIGAYFYNENAESSVLTNEGVISSKTYVALWVSGTASLVLDNVGNISSTNYAIYLDGVSGGSRVVNNGTITGNVSLGLGADLYDSRAGKSVGDVSGNEGSDKLLGSAYSDVFYGGSGNDQLYGYNGNDKLNGGPGKDTLSGGAGADFFIFSSVADGTTASAERDLIKSFSQSDKDRLDLHLIDANVNHAGDDKFKFIASAAFHDVDGELRSITADGYTKIYGDTNGDGSADFAIRLDHELTLKSADFIL